MPSPILREFLDKNNVKYITINHSQAFTAQEVAAKAHVPGNILAKAIMVKLNGIMAMAVLPASYHIDLMLLKEELGNDKIRLAFEQEFKDKFPDCEVGAMPPFGNLYDIIVYADKSLSGNEEIAFNSCNHKEVIKMSYKEWEKLVKPKIINFAGKTKL